MPSSQAIRQIQITVKLVPEGRVASYGQIADLAGLPGRARLVARALKLAAPEQQLPWHRIVRADGRIAFPVGSEQAQEQRQRLLAEGVPVTHRVKLSQWQWQPDMYELLHRLHF